MTPTTPADRMRCVESETTTHTPNVAYCDELVTVYHGDCLDLLAQLSAQSVHAVVTDPPYGLEFMGRNWDRPWAVAPASRAKFDGRDDLLLPIHRDNRNANCRACGGRQRGKKRCRCTTPEWDRPPREDLVAFQTWCRHWASACLRVLRPGGHLIAFGGTRTWHRLACALEDAGFEIRDTIAWLYATGFPKSHNISNAITKACQVSPEVADRAITTGDADGVVPVFGPQPDNHYWHPNQDWAEWGTALKPGFEPILVARKPLAGTVADTVLAYGTGGMNIGATRIAYAHEEHRRAAVPHPAGRWPTNIVLTHAPACTANGETRCVSNCPVAAVDLQGGAMSATGRRTATVADITRSVDNHRGRRSPGDAAGASRFFPTFRWQPKARADQRPTVGDISHPTVKPVDLMRWLLRLVTPSGGTIVDPFLGSGTTAEAARTEGLRCIGIERDPKYIPLIVTRLRTADQHTSRSTEEKDSVNEVIAA